MTAPMSVGALHAMPPRETPKMPIVQWTVPTLRLPIDLPIPHV
ncbi:hypothetical protein [Leptothoe sp. PORK10 BA2]|nr:hypothetical protein [Leptothoe sp. PORK10 BA2]MEA5465631.1 hypothetical protein [Leptothoe sp. PORK10 BA2]